MTLEDSILAFRLRIMARAEELENVTAACRELGISRTLFYRWRRRFERCTPGAGRPAPGGRPKSHPTWRGGSWARPWHGRRGAAGG